MSVSIESVSNDDLATYYMGDTQRVFSVAFHPNKQFVVFGCENSAVKLWNMRTKLYASVVPHMGNVLALRFSLDGLHLCSAASGHSEGNTLCVWECVHDVKDDEDITLRLKLCDSMLGPHRIEVLHQDNITDVAFAPVRSKAGTLMVASSSLDTTVRLWHFQHYKKMRRQPLRYHRAGVNAVTFSEDGRFLVSGSQDGDIVFCRLVMPELSGEDHMMHVGVRRRPKMVLEEDKDGNMVLVEVKEHFDLASNTEFLMVFRFNCQEPVLDVRFFPGFDFVTLVGANIKDNGPDRQYQLAVGTGASICLFKLHDTFLPNYEEADIVDYLIDTAEQDVRRTRFTDDSEITFPARKVNFAQVTLQMRKFLGAPVRSLVCSAISNKAASADGLAQPDDKTSAKAAITMAGFLKIKTEKMILGKRLWKKYWYAVDENQGQLVWYKNELMAGAPKGFQRLDAIRSVRFVKPKPGNVMRPRFKIKVIGGDDLILEAEHRLLMEEWMAALEDGRESVKPKAMVLCAAVGDEVCAFTVQASALQARKPTRQQMRAETIVPEVFQLAQTIIGKHDDKVISVAIPCEFLLQKAVSSGVIHAGDFLTASASADQSLRIFRWSLMAQAAGSDSESEDEATPDPENSHLASPDEGNYNFSRSKMLFAPTAGNINKSWMQLERPLTQNQLTYLSGSEPVVANFFGVEPQVVPEHSLRGGKYMTNIRMLRIVKDAEMEADSEEEVEYNDKEEDEEEDENVVMEMLSRRLLGSARLAYRAKKTAMAAQAVPREKLETVAEKLMERAATAVDMDEAGADEEPDPKKFGQLATFSRSIRRKEIQQIVAERDSCTAGDCTVI